MSGCKSKGSFIKCSVSDRTILVGLDPRAKDLCMCLETRCIFVLHFFCLNQIVPNLCGNANDTAGRSRAGVTGLLALFVPALAKVIGTGVDDDGALLSSAYMVSHFILSCFPTHILFCLKQGGEGTYPENTVLAEQLDEAVAHAALGVALAVSLEVAEITDVAVRV